MIKFNIRKMNENIEKANLYCKFKRIPAGDNMGNQLYSLCNTDSTLSTR